MSPRLRTTLCSLGIAALLTSSAAACLWDADTLQMERLRFPGVLEIITGKFVRHSKAYYEWRIKDRLKKLETQPNDPALIDDLAVGYDKLGQYDEGIAVLEKSLAANPNRYETLANLATLLFHAGRLEESKQHVEHALRVNPDAHFGREKYQLLLTEYVQQSELESSGVMNSQIEAWESRGFAAFVINAKFGETALEGADIASDEPTKQEAAAAAKAVLGMMHFADFDSPVLLEALGDLLMVGPLHEDNTQLAALAYLRASQLSKKQTARAIYARLARAAVGNHRHFHHLSEEETLATLDRELARKLAEGESWFAQIEANERTWIASGKDVDRAFADKYYESLDSTLTSAKRDVQQERLLGRVALIGLNCIAPLVIVTGIVVGIVYWLRRNRRANTSHNPV